MLDRASARSHRRLAVFGEFFFELVFFDLSQPPRMGQEVKTTSFARFPGGGVSTTSLVAAKLGTPASAITRVGRDAVGSPEWRMLVEGGVSTRGCEVEPHLPTAMTVSAAFDGDRMMITHDEVNTKLEKLLARSAVRKELAKASHVHMACAMRPPQVWLPAIQKLRKQGLTLSADVGWNPDVFESPQLPSLLKEFEFTFPNESEALAMTGEKTVEAAARKLALRVKVPVVKLGPDGSVAVSNGRITRVKSIHVRAVDATGAGDAFDGGFLHGYLAGWPLEECLKAGNICGALSTTRAGGSGAIPTEKHLKRLMKTIR